MMSPLPSFNPCVSTPPPDAASRPVAPRSFIALLMSALALVWLALTIAGPSIDHHYAERFHAHEHLYLNSAPVSHQHIYDADAHHLHHTATTVHRFLIPNASASAELPTSNRSDVPGGVAILSSTTASLLLTVLSAPFLTTPGESRPPLPTNPDHNPLARFANPPETPTGVNTPPPQRPPIP
jgi:hypothetical protein